jgi:hypothetical protein
MKIEDIFLNVSVIEYRYDLFREINSSFFAFRCICYRKSVKLGNM